MSDKRNEVRLAEELRKILFKGDDIYFQFGSGKHELRKVTVSGESDYTVDNEANNRVITSKGVGLGGNAETNLTFNGSTLEVSTTSSVIRANSSSSSFSSTFESSNDLNSNLLLTSHGSVESGNFIGSTISGKQSIQSDNELLIGTLGSFDLNIGTSNTLSARIDKTTQDWNFQGNNLDNVGTITASFYGGITEANLLDKSATETVSGDWTFNNQVKVNHSSVPLIVERTDDAASLEVLRLGSIGRTTALDGDNAYASLQLETDSSGFFVDFARIKWVADDVSDAAKEGSIRFEVQKANSLAEILKISGTGIDVIGKVNCNFTTEDVELIDGGSVGATEQDWIEVTVGGVTGYIRVFATK